MEELNKQIGQWHFDGFIDKNLKGVKEKLASVFSYTYDTEEVQKIGEKAKK